MATKQQISELRGVGKILDILWDGSRYSMGKRATDRIEKEMIYYFGKRWAKDMYKFIEVENLGSAHLIEPVLTLKEIKKRT